jgi:hypothetical protein
VRVYEEFPSINTVFEWSEIYGGISRKAPILWKIFEINPKYEPEINKCIAEK